MLVPVAALAAKCQPTTQDQETPENHSFPRPYPPRPTTLHYNTLPHRSYRTAASCRTAARPGLDGSISADPSRRSHLDGALSAEPSRRIAAHGVLASRRQAG